MKIIVALVLIQSVLANSSVARSTKNVDSTATPNGSRANISETKSDKKQEIYKTFNAKDRLVYVDDVLFALNNLNWTETEQPCLERTLLMLRNLQNFTLWAVWNWDSISSEPQGLLYGNRYQLGNFDECLTAPWYEQHPELRTQYCLADIVLERTDRGAKDASDPFDPYESTLNVIEYQSKLKRPLNKLTWGVCVPAACEPRSVEKLMGVLLARSHLAAGGLRAKISVNDACQKADEPLPYDYLFYTFIAAALCFMTISLACTILNYKTKPCNDNDLKYQLMTAFDLRRNAGKLLVKTDNGTDVLYGIKFLSMCIVVYGHQYGMFNGGPVSNGYKVDQEALSVVGLFVLHEDVVVDSFFLLSGFLTAAVLMKLTPFPSIPVMFFRRYMRLILAYAVVVFYLSAVFPYTGSGPLWNRAVAEEAQPCRDNWWLNMLMVSNYVNSQNMCLVVSWYIPCDFHFFVVTVLLYWLYRRRPAAGRVVAAMMLLAAVVTPGVINYVNSLPAIQLFTYDFVTNPRGPMQFHLTYIKSHTRYATYLVGFITGYMYTRLTANGNWKKISRKWSILGAVVGVSLMAAVTLSGPAFAARRYDALESAAYAALNRPAWACGVALLILCCCLGYVPIVNGFLSWYPWIPLSRLSYGLYLIHTILISRNVYVTRNPQNFDIFSSLTSCFGIIFEGSVVALLIFLLVEAPILNFVTICLAPRTSCQDDKNVDLENNCWDKNNENIRQCGNIKNNLPRTVQVISSKM